MKDTIKQILLHQLNECKIEPMEYIEYNKFVDNMTNEQVKKVLNKDKKIEKGLDVAKKLIDKKNGDVNITLNIADKVKIKHEQANRIAKVIQTRYPKAINNTDNKIQTLNQHRVQNPAHSLLINKKIARLRAIQNKYRVKNMALRARSKTPISK